MTPEDLLALLPPSPSNDLLSTLQKDEESDQRCVSSLPLTTSAGYQIVRKLGYRKATDGPVTEVIAAYRWLWRDRRATTSNFPRDLRFTKFRVSLILQQRERRSETGAERSHMNVRNRGGTSSMLGASTYTDQDEGEAVFLSVMSRKTKIAPGEAGYPFVSYQC
jgi:hypothetical protein